MTSSRIFNMFKSIEQKIPFKPEIAIVLGSGLGDYAEKFKHTAVINYNEIIGFPVSTVEGHKGRFVFCEIFGVKTVLMQGRVHFYEGYKMSEVVLPIRLIKLMNCGKIILTNAAGGVNLNFKCGDLMLITDHISSFVPSPLIGTNLKEFETRFADMTEVYNKKYSEIILQESARSNFEMKQGTYLQLSGPNYETPKEIKMLRILGADAVGMSTVCEAMVANSMGMQVCGISCITNMAAGIEATSLNHAEVQETANKISQIFSEIVTNSIAQICRE